MVIDFKFLCEEILLEEVLNPLLSRISADAINAKKDYTNQVNQPNTDKKFLFNALKAEINDLRNELKTELSKFKIDIGTPEKFDNWVTDRTPQFNGLKYILYSYIKESKHKL
jgi:hypothetical protein